MHHFLQYSITSKSITDFDHDQISQDRGLISRNTAKEKECFKSRRKFNGLLKGRNN